VGGKGQALAEMLERLVRREAGADGGDLEEDAARLAEVDRLEVETVDDGRGACARLEDPVAPRLVVLHLGRPRDVVHGSGAGKAGVRRRLVEAVGRAARVAAHLPGGVPQRLEAEGVLEEVAARTGRPGVGAD